MSHQFSGETCTGAGARADQRESKITWSNTLFSRWSGLPRRNQRCQLVSSALWANVSPGCEKFGFESAHTSESWWTPLAKPQGGQPATIPSIPVKDWTRNSKAERRLRRKLPLIRQVNSPVFAGTAIKTTLITKHGPGGRTLEEMPPECSQLVCWQEKCYKLLKH